MSDDRSVSNRNPDSSNAGGDLSFNIYGYDPSLAAAIVFIVAFGLITIVNTCHVAKSKTWWLSVLVVGGVGQVIGWAGRLWSAQNVYSLNAFLTQQICLILSPCFYSATVYGSLGMLIRTLGTEFSRLRPGYYLLIFCLADLLAIVVQAVGGAMAAIALQNDKASSTGTHIMVAGIVIQLVAMIAFCLLGLEFLRQARKAPDYVQRKHQPGLKVQRLIYGLSWASIWILVRCLYRVVELAQGWSGYLITHQPYFCCLDAVPMVLCQAVFMFAFPPFCVPHSPTKSAVQEFGATQFEGEMARDGQADLGPNQQVVSEKKTEFGV